MGKKPEVRFQRDLSSFPVQRGEGPVLSDNQAIATDAKAALAMGVAAAGVPEAQSVGLIGGEAGVAGTAAKYGQFLGAMADFVDKTEDLDFEIFKAINAAATFRLNTNASIGSLGGNPPGFQKINLPELEKQGPNETDEDFQAQKAAFPKKCAAFAANQKNRQKLAKNLKELQGAVPGSFGEGVHPMLQEFRAIQFIGFVLTAEVEFPVTKM
jgi:hypothetical protein